MLEPDLGRREKRIQMWKKNPLAPKMNKDKFLRLESPILGNGMRRTEGSRCLEAEDTFALLAGHVACKAARPQGENSYMVSLGSHVHQQSYGDSYIASLI